MVSHSLTLLEDVIQIRISRLVLYSVRNRSHRLIDRSTDNLNHIGHIPHIRTVSPGIKYLPRTYLDLISRAPTMLPSANDRASKGSPPYITTRFHTATYLLHILLDQDPSELPRSYYRILGTRREKLTRDTAGEKWILKA